MGERRGAPAELPPQTSNRRDAVAGSSEAPRLLRGVRGGSHSCRGSGEGQKTSLVFPAVFVQKGGVSLWRLAFKCQPRPRPRPHRQGGLCGASRGIMWEAPSKQQHPGAFHAPSLPRGSPPRQFSLSGGTCNRGVGGRRVKGKMEASDRTGKCRKRRVLCFTRSGGGPLSRRESRESGWRSFQGLRARIGIISWLRRKRLVVVTRIG